MELLAPKRHIENLLYRTGIAGLGPSLKRRMHNEVAKTQAMPILPVGIPDY